MPQPFLNHLRMHSLRQEQRCRSVTQIVETNIRKPSPLQQWFEVLSMEMAAPQWCTVLIAKNPWAGRVALGKHSLIYYLCVALVCPS